MLIEKSWNGLPFYSDDLGFYKYKKYDGCGIRTKYLQDGEYYVLNGCFTIVIERDKDNKVYGYLKDSKNDTYKELDDLDIRFININNINYLLCKECFVIESDYIKYKISFYLKDTYKCLNDISLSVNDDGSCSKSYNELVDDFCSKFMRDEV